MPFPKLRFRNRYTESAKQNTHRYQNIFLQSGLSRIELTSATEEVQVVWWNNHGYTHESPVEAVCLDNGELSLQLSDEDGASISLWEDSDFAFEHPAWLNGILNGLKEATEQS